jgi:hypothetical protein
MPLFQVPWSETEGAQPLLALQTLGVFWLGPKFNQLTTVYSYLNKGKFTQKRKVWWNVPQNDRQSHLMSSTFWENIKNV